MRGGIFISRSYKKHPWAGDTKGKFKKRTANHKVRNYLKKIENELKFSDYKKVYCSWEICDYGWLYSWKEYWQHCIKSYYEWGYQYYPFPDIKEEYKKWYKIYKRK